jgi:heterodisulfide reductase subunit A2
MDKPRIGVYVCWCGTNIAKMVDVEAIAGEMVKFPGVVVSRNYKYMCSDPGQELVIKDIKDNKLNRIVVSACSPRIHELTFRSALKSAGLNPYLLVMANIREHDAWVHTDRTEATAKARELVIAAISRVSQNEALEERMVPVNPATLVIGGGVSGMAAALEIADSGKKVYLVEKAGALGGRVKEVQKTFPRFLDAKGFVDSMINRVMKNSGIELFLETTVKKISGYVGNFETALTPPGGTESKILFGNIIVATGLAPLDPSIVKEYGYGILPDVVTSAEFEKMLLAGRILKKDDIAPAHVAIIHCVGSRNKKYHEYCSRTCCMTAVKYANQVRDALPHAAIYELYADMRAVGKGCEELYAETSRRNVMFMMFDQENDLPQIKKADPKDKFSMLITLNEKLSGKCVEVPADLVILMTGMEAREDAKSVAHAAGVSLDGNGFFIEKHPKLDPVATTTGGVYIAGGCSSPKDIPDAISQARAAAARVLRNITRGSVPVEVITSRVNRLLCCACKMCIPCCPYTAISFDEQKNIAVINEILCQGCGTCVALCRPKAINQQGYSNSQMQAEVAALLSEE